MLISDEHNQGVASGTPWQNGPVPLEFAITGLGPIHIRIAEFDNLKAVLEQAMLMREVDQAGSLHLFEMGEGGNGAKSSLSITSFYQADVKDSERCTTSLSALKIRLPYRNGSSGCNSYASTRPVTSIASSSSPLCSCRARCLVRVGQRMVLVSWVTSRTKRSGRNCRYHHSSSRNENRSNKWSVRSIRSGALGKSKKNTFKRTLR